MANNTTKDMTSGSTMKLILGFAVPLLMGMLFQQVYSLVDTIIVGRFLGVSALAAVGATGSINFLIIGFCQGICNGFGLPVAQRFGARGSAQRIMTDCANMSETQRYLQYSLAERSHLSPLSPAVRFYS